MKNHFLSIILFLLGANSYSQTFTISGYVKDSDTKEALIGVNIYDLNRKIGATTNNFGYYSINSQMEDSLTVVFSYTGYEKYTHEAFLNTDQVLNVNLITNNILDLVEVKASQSIEKANISMVSIPMKQIKQMPMLMGEADIMRTFQLMPGVQGGKEGTNGIFVRGGSPDQNLFLLDDIPLYYVSHIGGLMSTFDPNAINDVKLYKGGFPARYGGRLSSVIDIRMKNGHMQKHQGEFTIGTMAMKLSLEGPIHKDTSSYFISFRRCNIDIFTRIMSLKQTSGQVMSGYTFYDLYGKYNKIYKNGGRLYISFYSGRDNIFGHVYDKAQQSTDPSYKTHHTTKWGNNMISARYNYIFNPKLFGNFTIAYTRYKYKVEFESNKQSSSISDYKFNSGMLFRSKVDDIILKSDFDFYPHYKHQIKFGLASVFHVFSPGYSVFSGESLVNYEELKDRSGVQVDALEFDAYVEDNWTITDRLTANLGLRYSQYTVEKKTFYSLQPRLSLNFHANNYSLKASYVEMNQYVHLLSKSGAGMPTDIWVPATENLIPEKSSQFSIGVAKTLQMTTPIEFSVEAYYKTLSNLISYKGNTSFFGNAEHWESKIESGGKGEVYGLELLIQKKEGKTTGWIAYTLSKNSRQFDNINNGIAFPYKYDRRHDIAIVLNHEFSKRIVCSASWVYQTGQALTLAKNHYGILDQSDYNGFVMADVHHYDGWNSYRMAAFHKLDVSVSFIKQKEKGVRTWIISVYNLYSRYNPFYMYYKYDHIDGHSKLYQYSLLPIVPSISYSYRF